MKIKKIAPILIAVLLVFAGVLISNIMIRDVSAAEGTTVIFHYHRDDGNYDGWNMYYWDDGDNSRFGSVSFTAEDSFGKVAVLTTSNTISKMGVIVRKSADGNDWAQKDWEADRFITISGGKAEVWINSGQEAIQTSAPSGHSPYTEPADAITVNIHYYRYAEDYTGWSFWLWPQNGDGFNCNFTSGDSYGVVSSYRISKSIGKLGFIVKYNDWEKREPGGDRFIDLSKAKNGVLDVYLLENDSNVYYTSATIDKSQRIFNASIKSFNQIALTLSKPIDVGSTAASVFTVKDSSGTTKSVTGISSADGNNNTKNIILALGSDVDITKTYTVSSTQFKEKQAVMGEIYSSSKFITSYTYSGSDLGATYSKNSTTFKVWAPIATDVTLNLYSAGNGGSAYKTVKMTKGTGGVWQTSVAGDLNKVYYTYSITNYGVKKETVDLYARATGVNGQRGMVIDLSTTNPSGWNTDSNPFTGKAATDASIYELHIRDFTIDSSSGVTNKGKYLGLTEKGTTNKTGQTTGLDYIADLGVSHVQILPMYDYSPNSVDETKLNTAQFNWGYDPYNYNVPEGSYSTDPYKGEVRVNEMKQMIQAFHNEGIAVVMDVVYNHTAESENSWFNITVPGYYYRMNADGTFSNASGCGNEVASDMTMVRKYIVDSVVYWAKEYHVDGFRFDLMGILDMETMKLLRAELDKIDPSILLYGEGWTGGSSTLDESLRAVKSQTHMMPGVGAFSDDIRDGARGNISYAPGTGFISGATGYETKIKATVVGATYNTNINYWDAGTSAWAGAPTQTINYVSCHDNHTLWDKINSSAGSESLANRIKMNKLAAGMIYTSQGVPFMLSGEEILRTKPAVGGGFDHNSYKSPDSTNSVKWDVLNDATYQDVHDYYQGLIAFRNAHASLRMTTTAQIQNNLSFLNTGSANTVGFVISNKPNGEVSDKVCVIYNANKYAVTVSVPYGTWNVCVKNGKAGTDAIMTFTGSEITVDAISCLAMVQGTLAPDTSFSVPDVVGMDVNEARKLLEGTKYRLNVNIEWQTSNTVDENKVISSNPATGAKLSKGDSITIYASLGKEIVNVKVPNLINKTEAEAKDTLVGLGLKVTINYQYDDNVGNGIVVAQSSANGTMIAKGSAVEITVNISSAGDSLDNDNGSVDEPLQEDDKEVSDDGSKDDGTDSPSDKDENDSEDLETPEGSEDEDDSGDSGVTGDENMDSSEDVDKEDSGETDKPNNNVDDTTEDSQTNTDTTQNGSKNKFPGWVIPLIIVVIVGGAAITLVIINKQKVATQEDDDADLTEDDE